MDLNEQACNANGKSKLMITQQESSQSTGLKSTGNATSSNVDRTILNKSMSFVEAFPVKIFPTPEKGQDLMENAADYSLRPFAWFANYDRELLCWRTWQRCLLEGWIEFSGRWPRSGMMQNGIAYRLPTLAPRISETGCSSLPTPTAGDSKNSRNATANRKPGSKHKSGTTLCDYVTMWPTQASRDFRSPNKKTYADRGGGKKGEQLANVVGGMLNPMWVEWLMGFPSGWTELEDSETQ